jgi:hypothetical protein
MTSLKRSRAVELLPSSDKKRKFWSAVDAEDITYILHFCEKRPELMDMWRDHQRELHDSPFKVYAMSGKSDVRTGSLLALFIHGFDIPLPDIHTFLVDVFMKWSCDHRFTHYSDIISKRFKKLAKDQPGFDEAFLVAAAHAHKLDVFNMYNPKAKKSSTSFYLPFTSCTSDMTVLQAVVQWPDVHIRKGLVTDILAKCSCAYILHGVSEREATKRRMSGGPFAKNALEECVLQGDPDCLRMIASRLKVDAADYMTSIYDAAVLSTEIQVENLDIDRAMTQVQIIPLLDDVHLGKLRTHIHSMKDSAIRVKTALSGQPQSTLYQQACKALDCLERVLAACVSAIHYSSGQMQAVMLSTISMVKEEEIAFEDTYRTYLSKIGSNIELETRERDARIRIAELEEVVRTNTVVLKRIHEQAVAMSKLSGGEFVKATSAYVEDIANDAFLEDIEFRMKMLKLPLPPLSVAASHDRMEGGKRPLLPPIAIETQIQQ